MVDVRPDRAMKGRGAVSNKTGRYERYETVAIDDGWHNEAEEAAPEFARKLRTSVTDEHPKSIIATNTSPDIPFDRSINPYRGCEHGCVYCYARPTHAYMGLSPGRDFETKLFAKPNAAELLERALRKPGYRPETIQLGANTDPYQPIERERRITRSVLEVMADYRHPVGITTKSDLVTRDLDLLAPMAGQGLVGVGISVTTLDSDLARKLEPRAPRPEKRLAAIRKLSEAGVPVAVMIAPIIPFLTEHEVERVMTAAVEAGARSAGYVLLRLPLEIEGLVTEWLEEHAPGKAKHVLALMRESRGGRMYDSDFKSRMRGTGQHAELLAKRFALQRRKLGLDAVHASGFRQRADLFRCPPRAGDQMSLF